MADTPPAPIFQTWVPSQRPRFDIYIVDPRRSDEDGECNRAVQRLLRLGGREQDRLKESRRQVEDNILKESIIYRIMLCVPSSYTTQIRFHRGLDFAKKAQALCTAILAPANRHRMTQISTRGVLGVSPQSIKFDNYFRWSLRKIGRHEQVNFMESIQVLSTDRIPLW